VTIILINSFRKRLFYPNLQKTQQILISNSNAEVLLIYVYANTHSHAYENLKYFIDTSVRDDNNVDYYFILQQIENKPINENEMPLLPKKNAYYIQHENKCFDFGTFGWFLNEYTYGNPWLNKYPKGNQKLNLKRYKYFIFMNSSIRGPFFTPYFIQLVLDLNKNYYWYSVFTRRIDKKVKLVGCTISCETAPHVQAYLFATDFNGLTILLKPGKWGGTSDDGIFACHSTKDQILTNSELPASNRILESGYMIDSLLTKYQKVNFSELYNRGCNSNKNPYLDKGLEGTSLEPYEVVFVKYNDLETAKDTRDRAKLYQKWVADIKKLNRTGW
jgi:hypothetical protein